MLEFGREGSPLLGGNQISHGYNRINWWGRLLLPFRLRRIEKKLLQQVAKGLTASSEDVHSRFSRLDALELGALDETKTQLLISWAFDIDLKQNEWHAVFYHLAGPESGLAKREAILMWTDSLLKQHRKQLAVTDVYIQAIKNNLSDVRNHLQNTHGVIDHQARFAYIWSIITTAANLYMFLSVPYQTTLLHNKLLGQYFASLLISWGFDAILLLDIILKFNMSFVDERSLQVRSPIYLDHRAYKTGMKTR